MGEIKDVEPILERFAQAMSFHFQLLAIPFSEQVLRIQAAIARRNQSHAEGNSKSSGENRQKQSSSSENSGPGNSGKGSGLNACGKPSTSAKAARILVADDDPVNLRVMTIMLERAGMKVVTASNGQEAVEVFGKGGVDLVLMDCEMPVMDGWTAVQIIRSTGSGKRSIPIIVMTADIAPEDQRGCSHLGVQEILAKPFKRESLLTAVGHWLRQKEIRPSFHGRAGGCAVAPSNPYGMESKDYVDILVLHSLHSLTSQADPEMIHSIVERFSIESATLLDGMKKALGESDLPRMEYLSRRLLTLSLHIGARRLHAHAMRILQRVQEKRAEGLDILLDALHRVYDCTLLVLRAYCQGLREYKEGTEQAG